MGWAGRPPTLWDNLTGNQHKGERPMSRQSMPPTIREIRFIHVERLQLASEWWDMARYAAPSQERRERVGPQLP